MRSSVLSPLACALLVAVRVASAHPASSGATNLALRHPATQSSTYTGSGFPQSADLGVDGVIAPDQDPKFLFHTALEDKPWWQVDLGSVQRLAEVHLHNRIVAQAPAVQARAKTIQLVLSRDGKTWFTVYRHDGKPWTVLRFAMNGAEARYVRVQLAERGYLHLYEVEVYGTANGVAPPATPPTPPVTPPTPPAASAGAVLAEARIGPAGGALVAPGEARVTLPPGALAAEQVLRLRRVTLAAGGAHLFALDGAGPGLLLKPATVALNLPVGVDPARVCALHELGGDLASVVPARFDPKTRSLLTETPSFSYFGWDTYAKYVQEYAQKAGYGGIAGMVVLLGVVTITLPVEAAGLVAAGTLAGIGKGAIAIALFVGSAVGVVSGDAVTKYGLDHTVTVLADPQNPAARFTISWAGNDLLLTRQQTTAVTDPEGRLLGWLPGGVTDAQLRVDRQRLGDALGPQVDEARVLSARPVPLGILRLGAELCLVRQMLKNTGLAVPDRVDVLVRTTGVNDAGAWVPPFLNVGVATLQARNQDEANGRLATLLHEYYHACCYLNKTVNNTYQWLEEAIAVSLEAEFTGYEGYFTVDEAGLNFDWPSVGIALSSGLVDRRPELGDREDYSKRGYRLWPWARWLAHTQLTPAGTQGWPTLWRAAGDGLDALVVSSLFDGFALSVLTSDRAVRDPAVVRRPWDVQQSVKTGWGRRRLADLRVADGLALGRVALPPHLAAPRPLSLNVLGLTLPTPAATDGPLVVRRETAADDEGYWLLPQAAWTTLTPAATLRRAATCLVVPAAELAGGTWPLALVNQATKAGVASSLLAYRLNPPRDPKYTAPAGGLPATLDWSPPDLGQGLKPSTVLAGYRIYLRKPGQPPIMLSPPVKASSTRISPTDLSGVEAVGLASEDAVASQGQGVPLRSPIAWVGATAPQAGGFLSVRIKVPGHTQDKATDRQGKTTTAERESDFELKTLEVIPLTLDGTHFMGSATYTQHGDGVRNYTYSVDGHFNADRSKITDLTVRMSSEGTGPEGGLKSASKAQLQLTLGPLDRLPDIFGGRSTLWRAAPPKVVSSSLETSFRIDHPDGTFEAWSSSGYRPGGGGEANVEWRAVRWSAFAGATG